jgi:hypothetical protein
LRRAIGRIDSQDWNVKVSGGWPIRKLLSDWLADNNFFLFGAGGGDPVNSVSIRIHELGTDIQREAQIIYCLLLFTALLAAKKTLKDIHRHKIPLQLRYRYFL